MAAKAVLIKLSVLAVLVAVAWRVIYSSRRLPPVTEGFFLPQYRPVAELFRFGASASPLAQSYQTAKSHSRDVGFKSSSSSARLTAGFSSRSRQRKFFFFFFFFFVTSFESTLILCRLFDSIHI